MIDEEPLVIAFFLIMILVPWAAALFSAGLPASLVASWGSLDSGVEPPSIERPELRPRWAIGSGLVAGMGIAVVLVILYAVLHSGFDAATRSTDEFLFAFAFWLITATLAGQLLAGAIAAARAPRFGTLHGVLAGLVAGLAGTFAVAVIQPTSGCVPAFLVVEGRPCGRPPTGDFIAVAAIRWQAASMRSRS